MTGLYFLLYKNSNFLGPLKKLSLSPSPKKMDEPRTSPSLISRRCQGDQPDWADRTAGMCAFYLCAPLLAPFWSHMKNAGNFTNYIPKKASLWVGWRNGIILLWRSKLSHLLHPTTSTPDVFFLWFESTILGDFVNYRTKFKYLHNLSRSKLLCFPVLQDICWRSSVWIYSDFLFLDIVLM